VCTKVQGTGIRFKKVILKGFLRLSIQPVQLGGGSRARGAREKNPPALQRYYSSVILRFRTGVSPDDGISIIFMPL
jgi:hypothetical protein